ncbi:MAG: 23S rRNA (uracil(1939)-C(5))-methyltransferase RlmD, partial [Stenotrophomonas maltophilia]
MTGQAVTRGDHITLSLTSWGRLGEAMAKFQGWDVFVFGGIPGETVVAEILRIQRKYLAARVVELIQGSELRVEAPCPYYGECTGCQWQHLDYSAQLIVKKSQVVDALERVGGLIHQPVADVIPSPDQYGYRNHARFTVGPAGSLGFVHRETRRFVAIDRCMLMHEGINDLLTNLQGRCSETTQLAIRAGKNTGDYLVQPTLKNPAVPLPTGQTHYLESVGDQRFRVASPSFFQVNVEQAAQLVEVVRDVLDLRGEEVLVDAYAGVGTLAILLAPYVANVIAIEESSAAVADAQENAAGLTNVEFWTGKTEEMLSRLTARPDAVVLDPPRAGCQPQALRSLVEIAPEKVAYVSCDPESLARDLKILVEGGYHLDQVQPLDMFPQTHHVECVAALSLRKGHAKIILASASPRRLELLSQLGLDFQVTPSDVPEDPIDGESAEEMTRRLSLEKALAVS